MLSPRMVLDQFLYLLLVPSMPIIACIYLLVRVESRKSGFLYFFSKAMTAYRKVPLANPRRIAANAFRKRMTSRPWEKAKVQSEGEAMRSDVISLKKDIRPMTS